MGTKSQTLTDLYHNVATVNVLPTLVIYADEYRQDTDSVLIKIRNTFEEQMLVIRSSSQSEDSKESSNAGHFTSVLNVNQNHDEELKGAIGQVVESYQGSNEEVLIQPMLQGIQYAGVIFTADLDTLAPYYILNYEEGGASDGITSGRGGKIHTEIIYKNSCSNEQPQWIKSLLEQCLVLEQYFHNKYLDIEFGVDTHEKVTIFQVRPIARKNNNSVHSLDLDDVLLKLHKKVEKLSRPHPNLLGERTVFGVMPDWNPAEIIGIRPKKLALSLYKELITDSIWAHQRNDYGYRNLVGHPLLITFAGVPYIDVRVTFNSFIPKSLHENIANKLVNYYIDKLVSRPKYHDKVEFQIVYSCYFLGISEKIQELKQYDFSDREIKRIEFALLELTNEIIHPETGLYKKDIQKVNQLDQKYHSIVSSELSVIDKIYWLIEDCKQYGTLPFAGVARAAFIAVEFLKSFVELDLITEDEYDAYMNSLHTVNKVMQVDLEKVYLGELSREEFLREYGHIRPGTYEITSRRYDEDYELYFTRPSIQKNEDVTIFNQDKMQTMNEHLIESGITVNANELLQFIKESIEGREYTKFIFTRSLSRILVLMEELGGKNQIPREDMSYIDISLVKQLYSSLECFDLKDVFLDNISYNKKMYQYTQSIKLPSIILQPSDVYAYRLLEEEPNFITQKQVSGDVIYGEGILSQDLKGKIIFIQSADPGYDFIFGKEIGGLISQFGGSNSHMAIRCAELGIPAVIGIGEKEYEKWIAKDRITIDCLIRKVISYTGE